MPSQLLMGGHFAEYASDSDEPHSEAESAAGSDKTNADVEHVQKDPMHEGSVQVSPACSDADPAESEDIPADFIDFDEADELSYVVEEAYVCVCSSPNTVLAKPGRILYQTQLRSLNTCDLDLVSGSCVSVKFCNTIV